MVMELREVHNHVAPLLYWHNAYSEFRTAIASMLQERHSLQSVRFRILDSRALPMTNFEGLHTVLSYFAKIQGVSEVVVEGQNPTLVPAASALKKVMESSREEEMDFWEVLKEMKAALPGTQIPDAPKVPAKRQQKSEGGSAKRRRRRV